RLVPFGRHVHGEREPGGELELERGTAGAAVLPGDEGQSGDLVRGLGGQAARREPDGRGDRELRSDGELRVGDSGCLLRVGDERDARLGRYLHGEREPGGELELERGTAGAAVLPGDEGQSGDLVR